MSIAVSQTGGLAKSIAQLFVNSVLDSQKNESLTNFRIYLESSAIKGASHMELTNINCLNNFKPFHTQNNIFLYRYNGITFLMPLDTTQYFDETSLVTFINNAFTSAGQNVVMALSPTTRKYTFTTPGGTTFQAYGHFDISSTVPNRANLKMGFTGYEQPIANGSTVSADIPPSIAPTCFYVGLNLMFSGVQPSNLNLQNLSIRVPLNGEYGSYLSYIPSTDTIYELEIPIIDNVQFQIYDDFFLNPDDFCESAISFEFHFSN